jgi:GNAT superfamily N-acetyltransferase
MTTLTSSPICIRDAKRRDLPAAQTLVARAFDETINAIYTPVAVQRLRANCLDALAETLADYQYFVAESEGVVCGIAGGYGYDVHRLVALYVDPAHQGRRIGHALFLAVHQIANERGAWSLQCSALLNAVPFYERMGMVSGEENHFTYGDVQILYREMNLLLSRDRLNTRL